MQMDDTRDNDLLARVTELERQNRFSRTAGFLIAMALGLSLAANGGITFGNGQGTVALTTTASHDLCLFQSGSVDLSGVLTYVQL